MKNANASSERAWNAIEEEKRRDRLLRRVSIIAWTVTGVIVLLFAVVIGFSIAELMKSFMAGVLPWMSVAGMAYPLVIVLGTVSLVVATLSTIGIFLRSRSASLNEIQLRLAALEDMLSRMEGKE